MDYTNRLSISYYKTIATLNEAHKIYLVQHQETNKIYVKKVIDIYNRDIYMYLYKNPITGIPRIIDICEDDNQLIIIENYISGNSLQEKISSSPIIIDNIFHYMTELCDILEKLHNLQPPIVHRDIKPSNIIITEHDHIILLDFNAAKYYTDPDSNDTILLGTKGYAAPEQYGFGSSTPQTDIYALGIILKELTASLPLQTDMFNEIISKCTQLNPSDRYQSVNELKKAINQLKSPVTNNSNYNNNTATLDISSTNTYTNSYVTTTVPKTYPAMEKVSSVSDSVRKFLPPGFRTMTPWKILCSSMVYLMVFFLSTNLEAKDPIEHNIWIERISCLLIMLSIIFISFNYMDIQRIFPICKSKNPILHYSGIALLIFAISTLILTIMIILISIFSI